MACPPGDREHHMPRCHKRVTDGQGPRARRPQPYASRSHSAGRAPSQASLLRGPAEPHTPAAETLPTPHLDIGQLLLAIVQWQKAFPRDYFKTRQGDPCAGHSPQIPHGGCLSLQDKPRSPFPSDHSPGPSAAATEPWAGTTPPQPLPGPYQLRESRELPGLSNPPALCISSLSLKAKQVWNSS